MLTEENSQWQITNNRRRNVPLQFSNPSEGRLADWRRNLALGYTVINSQQCLQTFHRVRKRDVLNLPMLRAANMHAGNIKHNLSPSTA